MASHLRQQSSRIWMDGGARWWITGDVPKGRQSLLSVRVPPHFSSTIRCCQTKVCLIYRTLSCLTVRMLNVVSEGVNMARLYLKWVCKIRLGKRTHNGSGLCHSVSLARRTCSPPVQTVKALCFTYPYSVQEPQTCLCGLS